MKVLLAVFAGSGVSAAFAFVAQWLLSGATVTPTIRTAALGAPRLSLLVVGCALVAGSYAAARIHKSFETLSGFATVQLFFGPALIREFWLGGAPLYAVAALFIVIPLTAIGGRLAPRSDSFRTLHA